MMHDMGVFDGGMGWGMGFGWLFMLVFLALIVTGIITMLKWLSIKSTDATGSQGKTALDILKERYARGDIDQEEYQLKKQDIEDKHDHTVSHV